MAKRFVCLACQSPIGVDSTGVKTTDDGGIRFVCGICYTEGQVIPFERLIEEVKPIRKYLEQVEIRRAGKSTEVVKDD